MNISSDFALHIDEQYKFLIPIIVKGLGFTGEGDLNDYIKKHFNDFYENIRVITKSGLQNHFGDAGAETINTIINAYDNSAKYNINIYETNN